MVQQKCFQHKTQDIILQALLGNQTTTDQICISKVKIHQCVYCVCNLLIHHYKTTHKLTRPNIYSLESLRATVGINRINIFFVIITGKHI